MSCQTSTPHLPLAALDFFECNSMPFGLCNVPATFQRLMQSCLQELNLIFCLIYLDNIISLQMAEEHLHCLCIIFDQFREYNLKMKPSKCDFFQERKHLPSSSSLKGWGRHQQLEPEGHHRVHPTTDLYRGSHFSQSGGPLQDVQQGICRHYTAP